MIYGRLNPGLLSPLWILSESRSCVMRSFLLLRVMSEEVRGGDPKEEEVRGVVKQEDNKRAKTEAISQLEASAPLTLLVLYLRVSCLFVLPLTALNLETMPLIRTVFGVYSVCCRLASPHPLLGVVFLLWSLVIISPTVSECVFISFRMALWGTLMTWCRSTRSITAPPSATCVKGWRSYGNAK